MRHSNQYKPKYANTAKRPGKPGVWSVFFVFALVVCLFAGTAVAKYIKSTDVKGHAYAKEFYFTSNLLSEAGEVHTLNSGTKEITFTIGNNADKLRFSEVDVQYEVQVDGVDFAEGTLKANDMSTQEITLTGLQDGKTYTVTATAYNGDNAQSGYVKTLTATFTVQTRGGVYWFVEAKAGYTLLTVWSDEAVTGVTVDYSGYIPDNTNPNMSDWKTADKQNKIDLDADHSKEFRFFGNGTIKVSVPGDTTLIEQTPN